MPSVSHLTGLAESRCHLCHEVFINRGPRSFHFFYLYRLLCLLWVYEWFGIKVGCNISGRSLAIPEWLTLVQLQLGVEMRSEDLKRIQNVLLKRKKALGTSMSQLKHPRGPAYSLFDARASHYGEFLSLHWCSPNFLVHVLLPRVVPRPRFSPSTSQKKRGPLKLSFQVGATSSELTPAFAEEQGLCIASI